MEKRINFYEKAGNAMRPLFSLGAYLAKSSVEQRLLELISYRVSQINGCAYCLDMHAQDLLEAGETGQRLFTLDAWRETPFYTDRERAALNWAEAVTTLADKQVPGSAYKEVRKHFSEEELIDLTLSVIAINSFNRINIAFGVKAGTYKPGMHAAVLQ
jgi:AhpD family alkylhydroperoxidase